MRTKQIDPEKIIQKTIHISANLGLENLSTKKVSTACEISEGSLFNYFKNKNELLVQCLYSIDHDIDAVLSDVPINILEIKKTIRNLWFSYFNYLIQHGDNAKFYRQFRHSSYYTDEVIKGQDKSFSFFTGFLAKVLPSFQINTDIFWVYVIETTLNFAVRVVDGQLPSSDKDIEKYFSLIVNGINGFLKGSKNWK